MKRTLRTGWGTVWLFSAILLIGCERSASPVHETVLDNGLKVIVREDHRAPVVVSQVWYKIGAIDEPKGLTGISHVLEHMMFQGTKELKPNEFSRIIARNGGRENAFTGQDYTAYFQTLEKSRLTIAFKLEADRMQNLVINEERFKKEIQVVMEERRLRTEDKPNSLTYEKFRATVYQVHPYKDPVIGWMEDLKSITAKDLEDWYRRYYAPNNATLVVVGDVKPEEVFKLAKEHFGDIPRRKINGHKIAKEPVQTKPRSSEVKAPAKVSYFIMGYHAPRMIGDKQEWEPYALSVLEGVLDGGSSSRFSKELIRDQQIATSIGAGYSGVSRGPALFTFSGTPAQGRTIDDLEKAIHEQIKRVQTELVAESELKRVKAQVAAADVFQQDSVFYQGMRIGTLETIGMDHTALDDYVKRLQAVTAKQVREVAQKYFKDSALTKTVLIPQAIDPNKPLNAAGAPGVGHGRH